MPNGWRPGVATGSLLGYVKIVSIKRPDGTSTSSPVPLFSAVAISIMFGESPVELGCWQSQTSSTLSSFGRYQIGLLFRGSLESGVLGTTKK